MAMTDPADRILFSILNTLDLSDAWAMSRREPDVLRDAVRRAMPMNPGPTLHGSTIAEIAAERDSLRSDLESARRERDHWQAESVRDERRLCCRRGEPTMTPSDLQRARELCERATPGPWSVAYYDDVGVTCDETDAAHREVWSDYGSGSLRVVRDIGEIDPAENAAFIAASRSLVPALLAEVERLRDQTIDEDVARREHALRSDLESARRERDELKEHMDKHFPARGSRLGDLTKSDEIVDDLAELSALKERDE